VIDRPEAACWPGSVQKVSVPWHRTRCSTFDALVCHVRRYDPDHLMDLGDAAGLLRRPDVGFTVGDQAEDRLGTRLTRRFSSCPATPHG
jgi:hypothetical protein